MIFDYKYLGQSNVHSSASASDISFVPDFSRPQTFFRGVLNPKRAVLFREAISALHAVVIDEQRYQAPDNSAYLAWRKEQDQKVLCGGRVELEVIPGFYFAGGVFDQKRGNSLKCCLKEVGVVGSLYLQTDISIMFDFFVGTHDSVARCWLLVMYLAQNLEPTSPY